MWGSLLIIVIVTIAAFWLFGGEHYLAHKSEIDYELFHHQEDETNPLSWVGLFIESGACGAFIGLVVSSTALIAWNWRIKSD
jgi:hypothetical protein